LSTGWRVVPPLLPFGGYDMTVMSSGIHPRLETKSQDELISDANNFMEEVCHKTFALLLALSLNDAIVFTWMGKLLFYLFFTTLGMVAQHVVEAAPGCFSVPLGGRPAAKSCNVPPTPLLLKPALQWERVHARRAPSPRPPLTTSLYDSLLLFVHMIISSRM